jgi:hypothetical protein
MDASAERLSEPLKGFTDIQGAIDDSVDFAAVLLPCSPKTTYDVHSRL